MAGKFVITQTKNGQYMFNLKASNGQVILTSEMYTKKPACKNGIESVRKNSPLDERYERLESKGGQPYFVLKAANSQVVGHSQMYASVSNMENGIASVKANGADSPVVDETVE